MDMLLIAIWKAKNPVNENIVSSFDILQELKMINSIVFSYPKPTNFINIAISQSKLK